MSTVKPGTFVQIGDELASDEEYLGDPTSTFIEEGKIYAATPGYIIIDAKNRTLMVNNHSEKKRTIPRKGDTVICTVVVVRSNSAGCLIYKVNNRMNESGIMAQLHVSNMSKRYVEKIDEAIQKNDIIRAQVIGHSGIEWKIATTSVNNGVIFAQCRFCGTPLVRKNRDQLTCNFCGNTERRVIAPDYGMINEKVEF